MFFELAHRLVVTGSRNFPNTGHHSHEPGEAIIMHAGSTAVSDVVSTPFGMWREMGS